MQVILNKEDFFTDSDGVLFAFEVALKFHNSSLNILWRTYDVKTLRRINRCHYYFRYIISITFQTFEEIEFISCPVFSLILINHMTKLARESAVILSPRREEISLSLLLHELLYLWLHTSCLSYLNWF